MKSNSALLLSLASLALAQPFGINQAHQAAHLQRRALVTEFETVYETVTQLIDGTTTQLIGPTSTSESSTSSSTTTSSSSSSTSTSSSSSSITTTTSSSSSAAEFFQSTSSSSSTPPPATTTTSKPVVAAPAVIPKTSSSSVAAAPATAAAAAAAPAAAPASGGAKGGSFSGDITYYTIGLGSCGEDDSGKDMTENIVAVSQDLMGYGAGTAANPMCGRQIAINKPDGSGVVYATIKDKCMGCSGNSIDVSQGCFIDVVGSLGAGRVPVTWSFV